ncbi:MAG: VOC family protein [Butyrivibrio sp.]|nr:VOC family protein [Butyrivibrio sp.]
MITGVHHIAVISSTEKSVEFYNRLGFKEIFRKSREYDTIVLLEGYGIQLEMFIDPNHPERSANPERIGLRHLALKVSSCEEMSMKFKCGPIKKDWQGVNFCYTEDPDGLPIEFHE